MEIRIPAADQFELIKVLPDYFNPADFAPGGISHLPISKEGDFYVLRLSPIFCTSDDEFIQKVSGATPTSQMYALVGFLNNEIILGMRGIKCFAEYEFKQERWHLREYEDFKTREKTPAEMRFEVAQAYEELNKKIA